VLFIKLLLSYKRNYRYLKVKEYFFCCCSYGW